MSEIGIEYEMISTGTPPLTRFFGHGKTVLKENRVIGGVF